MTFRSLTLILAAMAIAIVAFFLTWDQPTALSPASPDQLVITTRSGAHRFTVELAVDDRARAKGLMFRKSLEPDRGMLFDFRREQMIGMWMQNTYIPLDMLFIRPDGTIASIARDTTPLSTRTISSDVPVRYVLEVNAGTAARIGAQPGDRVHHVLIAP